MPRYPALKLDSLHHFAIWLLLLLTCIWQTSAQNLVPNWDLEEFAFCPYTWDEFGAMVCVPWFGESNNYFNSCTEFPVGVPENFRGFQYAHSGVGYIGGYQDGSAEQPWVQLLEPLIAGECYYVSFYWNRADLGCTLDRLGALLAPTDDFDGSPQIDWQQYFSDTSDWNQIFGYFTATGDEQWLKLGNFYGSEAGYEPGCEEDFLFAYYYFDDVVVELASVGGPFTIDLGGPYTVCDTIILTPEMPDGTYYTWSDGSHGPRLIVTESGTYSVTVSWQCVEAEATTEVTVVGSPSVVLGPDVEFCEGETHAITLDPDAGDYLWSDGSDTHDYTFSESGVYSVTLYDDNCDITSDNIVVNVIVPPSEISLGNDTTLCGGETLTLELDPSDNEFEWQDNSTSSTYLIDEPGIYAVTITNMCGTASDQIEVTYDEPPEFDFGFDSVFLCQGEVVNFSFDEELGDFLWQDGSNTASYQFTGAGLYSLTVSNTCGAVSDEIYVTQIDFPEFELGGPLSFCPGGSLLLEVPEMYGEYEWQDGSTDTEYLVTAPGIYELTITNDCGTYTDYVIVEFIAGIEPPDLGPDLSLCPGDEVLLVVDQTDGDILWNDFSTGNTLLVNSAGTYIVTLSTVCGSYSDTINISVGNTNPELSLPDDFALCAGDTAILDAGVTNVSYQWNDGSQLSQTTVSTPGTYSLTITNACGSDVDSVTIVDGGPAPVVSLGSDTTMCMGDTVVVLPSYTHVVNWLWQDGSDTTYHIVTMPGQVYVQVSNACGFAIDTLSIGMLPEIPLLNLGPDTAICPGEVVTLSIQIPDVDILWSDGSTNTDLIITDSALVFATISNNCGVSTDTMTVDMLSELPLLSLGIDQTICPGEMITFSPGISDVTYLWHDASTDPEFHTSQPGIVHLTISNACGSTSDTIVITESTEGPQLNLGPDLQACEGDSVIIFSGILGVSYVWQDGSTEDAFIATASGTYHLTVQNTCGMDSDTIEVLLDGLPPVTSLGTDTTLCIGSTLTLSSDHNPATSELWQDGTTTEEYEVLVSGIYHLTQSNACGTDSDTIRVEINGVPPDAILGADTILCEGSILILTSNADAETITSWPDGSSASTFLVTQPGLYLLTQTNKCGADVDSILVSYQVAPAAFDLGPDIVLCDGETILLAAPPIDGTIEWQDGGSGETFLVTSAGIYSLVISNGCGITEDEIVVINDDHFPQVPVQTDLDLCAGEEIVLDVAQAFGAFYIWSTGSSLPSLTVTTPGMYAVTISTDCEEVSEEFVITPGEDCLSDDLSIYIPNVFSPNGDNINDVFAVHSNEAEIVTMEGSIFDRWGDLMYSSSGSLLAWDGKFGSRDALPGVYVYLIIVHYRLDGQEFRKRFAGDVTLVR